jgi:hypothetical protein
MALINNDTNYLTSARRSSGGVVVLLSIITCGIYGIYWNYTNAKLLYDYQVQNGAQYATDQSIITLILSLFGLGLVSSAIMQDTLNKIIEQQ